MSSPQEFRAVWPRDSGKPGTPEHVHRREPPGSGAGSFRQAIIEANQQPGADTIDFDVAGTIRIGRTSLPAFTSPVTIDGSTAPSFTGSPVVTVNFHGTKGLRFAAGSDGSTVTSLSLVKSRQRRHHDHGVERDGSG